MSAGLAGETAAWFFSLGHLCARVILVVVRAMITSRYRRTAAALLLVIVSGCAATGGYSGGTGTYGAAGGTAPDPRLVQQGRFFSRSGFQACAVGGGGAFLLTTLIEGKVTRNAIIAGVATCGVAMGANYYLDVRRSQYANNEQRLNAYIRDVRNDNARLASLIATTNQVIAESKTAIDHVKAQLAAGQISMAQANRQLAKVDSDRAYLHSTLAKLRYKQQEYQKTAAAERRQGVDTAALDAEIRTMQQQVDQLEYQLVQLNDYRTLSARG